MDGYTKKILLGGVRMETAGKSVFSRRGMSWRSVKNEKRAYSAPTERGRASPFYYKKILVFKEIKDCNIYQIPQDEEFWRAPCIRLSWF